MRNVKVYRPAKKTPRAKGGRKQPAFRYRFSAKLEPMLKESRDVVAKLLD
jgi:hypothetical protein